MVVLVDELANCLRFQAISLVLGQIRPRLMVRLREQLSIDIAGFGDKERLPTRLLIGSKAVK